MVNEVFIVADLVSPRNQPELGAPRIRYLPLVGVFALGSTISVVGITAFLP